MTLLGYFITFRTYGSWLHGNAAGSVDRDHNVMGTPFLPPDPKWEAEEREALKYPPVELDAERRFVVDATVREVCAYRKWALREVNVRMAHVHVVVTAAHTPERVMNDLKGYGTRRMREARILGAEIEPWAFHGSTRYLDTQYSFDQAVDYVANQQGPRLEMRCPVGWDPVRNRRRVT